MTDKLIDTAAFLPYWVGILLAALSFVLLHQWAGLAPPATADHDQTSSLLATRLVKTFCDFAQFFLPFCFLSGALLSAIRGNRRSKLFDSATNGQRVNVISGLTWWEFEQFVTEFFSRQGFTVRNSPEGPDGGIDIFLKKEGKIYIVQCKHYRRSSVGVSIVREQIGIMHDLEADGAFIVTSGRFTTDALKFSRGKPLMLIGGDELQQRLLDTSTPAGKLHRILPIGLTLLSFALMAGATLILLTQGGSFSRFLDSLSGSLPGAAFQQSESSQAVPRPVEPYMTPIQIQPEEPGTPKHYAYSYRDGDGVFQTIASPEQLDYELVDGIPYYSGKTVEGKRLAEFLNSNR